MDVVHVRHGALHSQDKRLLDYAGNATQYPYGYLRNADTLCFWRREMAQVDAIVTDASGVIPDCLFSR